MRPQRVEPVERGGIDEALGDEARHDESQPFVVRPSESRRHAVGDANVAPDTLVNRLGFKFPGRTQVDVAQKSAMRRGVNALRQMAAPVPVFVNEPLRKIDRSGRRRSGAEAGVGNEQQRAGRIRDLRDVSQHARPAFGREAALVDAMHQRCSHMLFIYAEVTPPLAKRSEQSPPPPPSPTHGYHGTRRPRTAPRSRPKSAY